MSYYQDQRTRLKPVVSDALAKARHANPNLTDVEARAEARRDIRQMVADLIRELNNG